MKRSSIEKLLSEYYEEPTTNSVDEQLEEGMEIRQDVFMDEGTSEDTLLDFQASLDEEEEELQADTAAFSRFFSAALNKDVDVRRIVRTFFSSREASAYRTGLTKKPNNR